MRLPAAIFAVLFVSAPVQACDLALVLAVDVSGSVDATEYQVQMQGLAAALQDGAIVDALIDSAAMVSLIQWSGSSRQRRTLDWQQMTSAAEVSAFAQAVAQDERVWRNYSTAIGEALGAAMVALDEVTQCRRKVIDVSGDGISNEGSLPATRHDALRAQGVTVNALAIETDDEDLTGWFFENLIVGEGAFVMTARGFEAYPAQIRRKLMREITKQTSALP